MKPQIENVPRLAGRSLSVLDRQLTKGIPFIWHHHPEVEITLTLNCKGQRFIGDNIERFDHGDLVLVGSNLPHSWVSQDRVDPAKPFNALVIWFNQTWLEELSEKAPELSAISQLCAKMHRGLRFSETTKAQAQKHVLEIFKTPQQPSLFSFLQLMEVLARDQDATPIASRQVSKTNQKTSTQLNRVLNHIHENYQGEIRIATLADIAALSPSALDRMFQRQTKQSISSYVMNLRIGAACAQLTTGEKPIAAIASDVGYHSLANFNRQFKKLRNMTPRAFRTTYSVR